MTWPVLGLILLLPDLLKALKRLVKIGSVVFLMHNATVGRS